MRDYEEYNNGSWRSTEHKRLIHHLSRSAIEWAKCSTSLGIKLQEEVLHVILSHHGNRLAASPVAPKTREAWLVHLCDGISARLYDADTFDIVKI